MKHAKRLCHRLLIAGLAGLFMLGWLWLLAAAEPQIDFQRARQLLQKVQSGDSLTPEEQQYLDRAREERRKRIGQSGRPAGAGARIEPKSSVGFMPLCDMGAADRYKGEDGGLYGGAHNTPPEEHRRAAERQLAEIRPLNADGRPAADGKIVLVSISMSNATQEFSRFKQVADTDQAKSPLVTIVDCAQGGQAMAEWVDPEARPWAEAARRLAAAGISARQVQVAWVKLANKGPQGDLGQHGRKLHRDTLAVLDNARGRFPNLRVAYLSSRIYGGYATTPLNPEPYAYESAFAVRWLIQDQIRGDAALNYDPDKGAVRAPLLLWGPYLWADGAKGRKIDDLVWNREDLAGDGTHPSTSGRDKVTRLLLDFFKSDPLAKTWFVKPIRRAEMVETGPTESRRPNVLVLMADHVAESMVGPQSQCLKPNLDRLATEGVRFSRCYTPNGMCSPARASLMTATFPSTHGVWDCTHTQRKEWVDVAPTLVHWAQRLDEAGYRTGYFGKWHVTQSERLEDFGWQEHETVQSVSQRGARITGTEVVSRKEGYRDVVLAAVRRDDGKAPHHPAYDLGIDFIRRHASAREPFCCFVSTSEPGSAIPPKRFVDMYDVKATRVPLTLHDDLAGKSEIVRRMQAGWKDVGDEDWRRIITCYLAQLTFLDSEMGRIVQVLKDTGCYENTIILFLADHGQMLGAHGLVGLGLGLAYEEVYRVPLILRLPERLCGEAHGLAGREVSDALVSLVDVGPTLLDLCGLAPLPQAQGRSLRPLLEGSADKSDWQEAYGEFFAQRFMYTQRIVWHSHWKYVFSPGGVDELYHLVDDPYEQNNLAADPRQHDVLVDMAKRMWRTMARIGDESLLNSDYATLRTAPIGPGSGYHRAPRQAVRQ